eukprot:superscaffoldBa00000031_g576
MDCYSDQQFKIQLPLAAGRVGHNVFLESKSSIKEPSDISVRTRSGKRKTSPDVETPQQRKKGSKSASGSLTDIDVRMKTRKRPASGYQEGTRKRQRTSQTKPCNISGDFVRVGKRKRKAAKNGGRQMKRQRVSDLKQYKEERGDATSSSLEAATLRKEKKDSGVKQRDNNTPFTSEDT